MRIATFVAGGRRQVGQVSADGQQVTPFKMSPEAAQRGAQALVEAAVRGEPLPALESASLAIASVKL